VSLDIARDHLGLFELQYTWTMQEAQTLSKPNSAVCCVLGTIAKAIPFGNKVVSSSDT
jgi:hypothetical protein